MKAGFKQSEVGIIPEDWEVCPVGRKGEVVTGKALAVNGPGRQRPYLRTKNVFDGRIAIDDVLTMPMTDEQFSHFRVRNGDVLLNEGQSLELVGRCAMYQEEYPEPCAIQNQLIRFRARAGVSGTFASYLFRHCQQTGVFARIALQTTSIAHLGGSRFERLLLAWPKSEAEQRSIAEALSDVDALLGALDRLIAKKRDLKQAAMQQLLTGQKRLAGFRGEWEMKRLGDVVEADPENLGGETKPDYAFRYISLEDVDRGTLRGFTDQVFATAPSRARRKLRPGDVLVSTVRPNLKSHLSFQRDEPNWVCSTGFCVLRCRDGVTNAGYVFQHLFAFGVNQQIEALLTGSNYPAVNSRDVRALEIPYPAFLEQTAIAQVLSEMDAELTALEQRRDKTRALKQGMMQELLTGRTRLVAPEAAHA
ncbi:restriction endonuclease subunit S [Bradyrhizobium ontarionense]|uniref:Restriction endonuclease subunit S n=1 Tax=Bradyrhizobium ontarionense TaxID=2898149 RepID=A0ABY3RG67_9BRAD|nr:restriction endonuclease subunit S [Bradyrhizobium sp. A19]UFZ06298.1 restriction endonuclease subunit S [Bradyrhizobium sp. A19]